MRTVSENHSKVPVAGKSLWWLIERQIEKISLKGVLIGCVPLNASGKEFQRRDVQLEKARSL